MLIPIVETVIAVPYDVEIILDNEKIGAIIKAKNAIPESNHLVIESKKGFPFGFSKFQSTAFRFVDRNIKQNISTIEFFITAPY